MDRRPASLRLFDEMDDLSQGRIGADLFDADDEVSGFNDTAGIDGRLLLFDGRIRFAGNGGLIDSGVAVDNGAVDANLFAEMNGDEVAPFQRFYGNLAFPAVSIIQTSR